MHPGYKISWRQLAAVAIYLYVVQKLVITRHEEKERYFHKAQ